MIMVVRVVCDQADTPGLVHPYDVAYHRNSERVRWVSRGRCDPCCHLPVHWIRPLERSDQTIRLTVRVKVEFRVMLTPDLGKSIAMHNLFYGIIVTWNILHTLYPPIVS